MSQLFNSTGKQAVLRGATALRGGAAALLCGLAALLLWRAFERLGALLAFPYPHDGLEGTLLYQAGLLWSGQPLYQPLERFRFVSAPYPPWHPLVLGAADLFAGPHLFWSGRLVSFASALLVAGLAALLVRRAAGGWLAGLLAVALFLSAPPVVLWATRIKPDMYALLWTALGLYLLTRLIDHDPPASSRPIPPAAVLAALSFALALFTKQTAAAAPLAGGLALLSADLRDWRAGDRAGFVGRAPLRARTIAFGATYLAFVGATWLVLDAATAGQFSFHVWTMHRRAVWTPQLMGKFVALLAPYWPSVLLGLALLAGAARNRRLLVPMWYLLIVPATLLGAGKTGANHNHLLETHLALALAGGAAFGWALGQVARRPALAAAAAALLAVQLALALGPHPWYSGELAPGDTPERYVAFIRNTPGEVLADNPSLLYMAGKPLRYDDPSGIGPVALRGVWDQSGLVEDIENQVFSAILILIDVETETQDPAGRWTPEMLAAVREHYRVLYRDTIFIYVPKEEPRP